MTELAHHISAADIADWLLKQQGQITRPTSQLTPLTQLLKTYIRESGGTKPFDYVFTTDPEMVKASRLVSKFDMHSASGWLTALKIVFRVQTLRLRVLKVGAL